MRHAACFADHDPVASAAFGGIEHGIGLLKDGFDVHVAVGPVRYPQRNGDVADIGQRHVLDQLAQALGGVGGGIQRCVGQQQQKLFAAHTAGYIAHARDFAHGVGQLREHFVTRVMAKAVVDAFEVVDVDGDDGEG